MKTFIVASGGVGLNPRLFLIAITGLVILFWSEPASAQDKNLVVRIAKLQIDSAQLKNYRDALKEEIETSVRVEAGVLTLNAVAEKIIPHILPSWKSMPIPMHTNLI